MEQKVTHSIPVLKSKLIAPELPEKAIFSERLQALGIGKQRCTIITAPAGYGKTTSVLLALAGTDAQVCWYRLEREDGRFPVFAAHLVSTLFQNIADKSRLQSADMLSKPIDDISLFNPMLCHDAWECFDTNAEQVHVYLVLEDFHYAANQSEIVNCVRYILSNMPPCVHIIITSRRQTGLEAGCALTKGITALGTDALRFTQDEIRIFCEEKFGIAAQSDVYKRIYALTEGWAAGIVMTIYAFKASGGMDLGGFLEKGMNSGEIFDYLTSQILQSEDGDTINLLARLALLEDFRAEEVSGIFGIADAGETIDAIAARNLFLTKTITDNGTVFRFHSLYKRALAAVGRYALGSHAFRELHMKIAGYYLDNGVFDRAVRHYLACGETDSAANIISANGDRMLNEGATETVKMLVESFPEEYRENHPYLLMYEGVTHKRVDFNFAIRRLEKARGLFEAAGNHAMRIKACLFLMMTCVYQNRLDIVNRVAQELQTIPGAMEDELCRRSLMLLSLSKATLSENFREGNALFSALQNFNLDQEERCGTYLYGCALRHRQGDLNGALYILDNLFPLTLIKRDLYWRSFALSLRSRVLLLRGELDAAQENVQELLELGEQYAHHYSNANGRYYLALIKYLTHDTGGAIHNMCGAQRNYMAFENSARAKLCRLHHYLWLCGTGDSVAPSQILGVYRELADANPMQGDDDLAASLAGAALRESGEYEQAEKLLLISLDKSERKNAKQSAAGTALHLSKLYFDTGDSKKGVAYLKNSLLCCAENDYTVLYDLHFPTLVASCARAAKAQIQSAHACAMIRRYFGAAAERELAAHADALCSSDASVKKFIRKFSRSKQPLKKDIHVQLFGGLKIVSGDAFLDEKSFKTRKISGIVKYLLLNRNHYTSREKIACIFWSDMEKKAALNSLRVALCEIRKALSGIGVPFEDKNALITEGEYGLCILKKSCKTDTDMFEELFHKSKSATAEEEKNALFNIIDLYQDGLLPLDVYDDYTALDREYYNSMFHEAAHRAAAILIAESDFKAVEALLLRVIKLDPGNDSINTALIRLYRQTGQHNLADAISRQLEMQIEA